MSKWQARITADSIRTPTRRRQLMLLTIVLCALGLTGRALQLQLLDGARWRARAIDQHAKQTVLPAPRGTIYDRNGVPLAASSEAFRINIAPREVTQRTRLLKKLRQLTNLDERTLRRAFDQRRRWVVLPGRYDSSVRDALHGMRGVYFDRVLERFYPHGPIAREVIGTVNSSGKALGGVELEFDAVLSGEPGLTTVKRDSRGREIPGAMLEAVEPVPGHDVFLTLDYELQEIAGEALRAAVDSTRALGGQLILADPRTGEVLAAASVQPAAVRSWRAAIEPYEPGSTLKPFAVAALLAEKAARLSDSVYAENGVYVNEGRTLRDVHALSWVTVSEALQQSSNIALAKLSTRLDPARQYEYLRAFGFGSPTGVRYPAESSGLLRRPQQWSRYSQASLAIGYEISVTPLQLVLAYGALANGGLLMEPRLVREVRTRAGRVARTYEPRVVRRVIQKDVARDLRVVLAGVVAEGTGGEAAVGPFAVAGKTGTARSYQAGHYQSGVYTSSFAGFFPADDPQLVFLVKLDAPQGTYYGGRIAAPVTRATLEAVLAARSTPLDKSAVASAAPPPLELRLPVEKQFAAAPKHATTRPFILALNASALEHSRARSLAAAMPEVKGLSVRDAATQLHASGYRVQVQGSGAVRAAEVRGSMVRLLAEDPTW